MSLDITAAHDTAASSTRGRVAVLAVVLGVTSVAAVAGGLLWPEPAGGGETYSYADIAADRDLWWTLLTGLAAMQVLNIPLQALATMFLVRRRGSAWATWGAALMWIGGGLQGAGVAGWAAAYFFPTDPGVDAAAGEAVIQAANNDTGHLFAFMIPGAALVLLGTVLQCVGLFRSHAVPAWVPVLLLFIVLTFVIPGDGLAGLLTSVPMAVGAIGLGYHAWRAAA
ncbi:hypothetical protein SK854_08270 [Lentzea sp. BCCO 10_0061]|uniref:DUF4386 family protein n=1 Tax=Lentzea sokolovensis TaxID=3095429 RepID=A0ABU4URI7_9PSEU|nr:hypothetical protein [Lentzea sp. BCCO 10_0061]MDX8142102.1 hypothetical protein [Lentzea sp. BCCO 10_0061]